MYLNTATEELAKMSVLRGESIETVTGAIVTTTGEYTGRAPNAKFYVKDKESTGLIDWSTNKSISKEQFNAELKRFLDYKTLKDAKDSLFCQELRAVRDPAHSIDLVVYTELAKHAMFARNMFIPGETSAGKGELPFFIYHFPNMQREAKVIICIEERTVLITGSHYSGEIKKSVFSALNFLFPLAGDLPMHCSVNVDKERKNPAIFFGLSGTGKTTLSSDTNRILIGDDEHGWTSSGLTNFEGGCYAKTIRLSKKDEPQIWNACNAPGAILENVPISEADGRILPVFYDGSITENTRASYPCENVEGADPAGFVEEHPKNIIMLTCDAFGVLPAVMKLSPEDAVRQFLLGYTAKVAGTETGVLEPQATFSACFGAPFMPLPPRRYADILMDKVNIHQVECWLVNTGWAGGPYGVGERMPISVTRTIIDKIHDGTLAKCAVALHEPTGFFVPVCEDLPAELLSPEMSWKSREAYDQKAQELMELFAAEEARLD